MKRSGRAGPKYLEALITGLAAGGDAVAREEEHGRTLFVFGGVPGERVRLRITEEHPRFARGEIEEILSPSPRRLLPPCPYFGRCGGCDWQQIPYPDQLAAKQEALRHALSGFVIEDPVASPAEYGYRSRARLHFRREGKKLYLGYHARGSTTVVDVERCLLLMPDLARALAFLRETLAPHLHDEGTISLLGSAGGERGEQSSVSARISCRTPLGAQRLLKGISQRQTHLFSPQSPLVSLSVSLPGGSEERFGAKGVSLWEGRMEASGGVFSQANPYINERLRQIVVSFAGGEKQRVLELYAGVGNFTLPLIESGALVLAVESDKEALFWLRQNTRGACEILAGDAAERTRKLIARKERFDVIVLDPPRAGARPVVELLPKLYPQKIVYVSCQPRSLARDAEILRERGYIGRTAIPLDMFPQSAHLETVALFERAKERTGGNGRQALGEEGRAPER